MKKKNCFVLIFIFSLFVTNLSAVTSSDETGNNDLKNGMTKAPSLAQSDVIFVNTGQMNISSAGVIYIPQSVRMLDDVNNTADVEVVLNGDLYVGGDFYQDAANTVFKLTTNETVTDSEGTIHFVDHPSGSVDLRKISTTGSLSLFDRSTAYVSFPNVSIETNDQIKLEAQMGMDALSIKRLAGKTGTLLLESTTDNGKVYDASLRIFGAGTSEQLVDKGTVIVAKDVSEYRGANGNSLQLFPFATPFKNTQLAGYFAGNWLRVPSIGDNHHTEYILGNKPSADDPTTIDMDQFERYALRKLKPGQPYLVKLREDGFDYESIKGGEANNLAITDGTNPEYQVNKFIFNGDVYSIADYQEQLFADDVLLSYSLPVAFSSPTTLNWVIGNSYTSPISTVKLVKAMQNTGITFSNKIYVYAQGSQTYSPLTITNYADGNPIQLDKNIDIPSMGVFIVRVAKNRAVATGNPFKIDKGMLKHSTTDHSIANAAPEMLDNQVRLTMTPEGNEFVYDKIAVGLRADASFGNDDYDVEKIYNNVDNGFQLYTNSSSLTKLSINGLPSNASNVDVFLKPAATAANYVLKVSDLETLNTEGAWLEDLITKDVVDLFLTNEYKFSTSPNDSEKRFILHFKKPSDADNDDDGIRTYYYDGNVVVNNLTEEDVNSLVTIYDVQGRIIKDRVLVDSYPSLKIPVELINGVYVTQVKGTRNLASKFVKQ